ncbi:MAG TPA: SRPBCC domain-containing protein [Anaerolineales bacterium]|nr:SRPBCC domain-containing protein [Anaerolineales bacterium]
MSESIKDRELTISRLIDAPRDLVFSAFTELDHIEKWWIPGGTTHEWEGKPGGLWRYSQSGPGGVENTFKIEYIEITRPTRFVYDFASDVEGGPDHVHTTVTFEEQEGKTKVTMHLLFATAAAFEEASKFGAEKGAALALRSLAKYLENLS